MQRLQTRRVFWSAAAGIVLEIAVAGLSNVWSASGVLLLPGMLLGAIFFHEGIHSSYGVLYLITAGVLNAAIYAALIFFAYDQFAAYSKLKK